MCGIAGVLEFDGAATPSPAGLERMGGVLSHRGPDELGFYRSEQVGFAHRRLKIIDLIAGQQPMADGEDLVHLVFNGEIYNYLELKSELRQKGHRLHTDSDTEVLLASYLEWGTEAFSRVDGMFACAFWDRRHRQLVLARDRFGKKPLFYYRDQERFLFGSEIKSLLAYGGIEREVHPEALDEYLTYGFTIGDQTILKKIRRLPPAHLLIVKDGELRCQRYWQLQFEAAGSAPTEAEAIDHVGFLLRRATERRLMSDVPLGAFLSGGLDSSVVVALMSQLSSAPVRTFSIGFEESDYSELEDARVVAKHLGTDHDEIMVSPSALEILPDLVWFLDEPFGDSSAVPTYYVCQAARRHVTVALSGDGGDESFAGYARYLEIEHYRSMQKIPLWLRRGIARPLTRMLPFETPGWNYLYAMGHLARNGLQDSLGIYPYIRHELYSREFGAHLRSIGSTDESAEWGTAGGLDPVSRYQYLDTTQYLPCDILTKVDRMSMANSLEVRSPLLDTELVEYLARLPVSLKLRNGQTKYILRKVAQQWLPASVLEKPKQGFAIPKERWFRGDLRVAAEEMLLEPRTLQRGYFRQATVKKILEQHMRGKRDYSTWIWCLMILEMWFRTYLDQPLGSGGGRIVERPAPLGHSV